LYELGIWAAVIFIKHTQAPSEDSSDGSTNSPSNATNGENKTSEGS